jgi:hypothetical protein
MQFAHKTTQHLGLDRALIWIIYLDQTRSFVVGDEKKALALSVDQFGAPTPLPAEPPSDLCNLPIPGFVYDEFRRQPWHGFQFLDRARYAAASDGDLLRTLVFRPDYGHPMLHAATGAIVALKSGSIQLLDPNFKSIDKTKTRGRAALAFAAHPTEGIIAYGDNYGTFHAHRFDASGFGKASKIASKERNASRLEFVRDGSMLMIGGMGYLQTYSYASGKFAPLHETSIAVRDFLWLKNGELVLVNSGMHGITALRYNDKGFSKIGQVMPPGAVQQMVASDDARYVAASDQDSGVISVYEIVLT